MLFAGTGVDTLVGGTGGDTFEADDGLASGSSVTGHGSGNTLVASGNISGATITDIQTLDLVGNVILTSTEYSEFTTVDGTGSYTISDGSITAASAATHAGTTGLAPMLVIDTAANIQTNLDALQTLVADSELTSVTLTDLSPTVINLTATQLADDTGALGVITGTYYLSVTGVTAANASTVAADTNVISVAVSDTAANVTSNIAALETLAAAGSLVSTAFTDSGTPALSFSATDAAADIDAIATFTGTFTLTVSDTAANVATNIDALGELAAIGDITSITLTDGGTPTLALSATQVGNDAAALALITSAYAVAVSDTGADVAANLDALQALATASLLSSITLTDSTTPTLSITQTQLSDDSGALASIGSTYDLAVSNVLGADAATVAATTGVTSVSVADTAANVESNLSTLETLATSSVLSSIFLTDTSTPILSVTESQLTSDADALALIAGSYDLTVTSVSSADAATVAAMAGVTSVSISDTAANVVANLDELQALAAAGELGTITLTDSGTPTLSLSQAQISIDAGAIAAITGAYHISLSSVLAGSAATVAGESGVTSVAVSDTAANVAANLNALETLAAASKLASITLIDTGTPTLTITATQLGSDTGALATIVGSYDLAVTSVPAANASTVATNTHVTSINVSDTAANVASNIDALQGVGTPLTAITLTDGGTPSLDITATQFTNDATAIGKIGSAYDLVVSSVLAANAATVASNSHVTSITISDTAADVVVNLAALQGLGTKLTSITLTDSGTPTLSITYSQLTGDSTALGKISGSYNLAVSVVSAANAATVAAESHVTSVSVSDTAANVVTNLASLETLATASTLSSIVLTNGGTPAVTVTYTQLTSDSAALGLITSAHTLTVTGVAAVNAATVAAESHVTSVSVSDSSANVVTSLDSLQTVAGEVTLSIALTDGVTPTLDITGTQFTNDATAIREISSAYHLAVTSVLAANVSTVGANTHVTSITVSDNAANVASNIDALQAQSSKVTTITLTDSGTPTLTITYTQLINDQTTLNMKISGAFGIAVTGVTAANSVTAADKTNVTSVLVSDTAAHVVTSIATLQSAVTTYGNLTSITLTDGGTPTLNVTYSQFSSDAGALSRIASAYNLAVTGVSAANAGTVAANTHVTSISVSDTSANVASNIDTLESIAAQLNSIAVTDGTNTITITAAQAANDYAALSQLTGTYKIGISDTAANISTRGGSVCLNRFPWFLSGDPV
jgi:hypothetical protein